MGTIYRLELPHRTVVLSEFDFDALWPLKADCAPRNSMRGHWETQHPDVRAARERLWADALIDRDGNLTTDGTLVVLLVEYEGERFMRETHARTDDLAAAEELDRLDRRCRRRPRQCRYDG